MNKLLYCILSGCIILSVFSCQQHRSNTEWIRLADEQVGKSTDSIRTLLAKVKRPLELKGEDRLLYGWLSGYMHAKRGTSMVEDSLLVPLADTYITSQDTTRKLLSYWLKARYTGWLKKHEEAFALYEEGFQKASELKDTFWMQDRHGNAGGCGQKRRHTNGDIERCIDFGGNAERDRASAEQCADQRAEGQSGNENAARNAFCVCGDHQHGAHG